MTKRSNVEWHAAVAPNSSACPPLAADVFTPVVNGGRASALAGTANSNANAARDALRRGRTIAREVTILMGFT